ncbi:MAG: tol-pal system protein YbgF [Pseudomonadales bacterium]|nr:tol-pal system protein YbgF [Pseudomonadales bacterium]NIX09890.1 tol-pal system protein YbgF [Pseudomonadales bacterium]
MDTPTSKPHLCAAAALTLVGYLAWGSGAVTAEVASDSGSASAATSVPDAVADPVSAPAEDASERRRLAELFYQLQILRQEVQDLRGLVEEQSYQLNRLAKDQQEQYLDLDRRVSALRAQAPEPTLDETSPPSGGPVPGGVPGSEREAYTAAFNQMKNRQFDEAVASFNALVSDYPNGQFTPNAFYWLGELHLAQAEDEMARQSFSQVINLYPDHQKVPDSLYKLGIVHHRLGDAANALQFLERVIAEYPESSAAGLARTYSAEIR